MFNLSTNFLATSGMRRQQGHTIVQYNNYKLGKNIKGA